MAVITASPNNFSRLLELQKLSLDHLDNINKNITESLAYERLQALEQLALSKEIANQENKFSNIENILSDILDTLKSKTASISNTNITTNQQQSSTLVAKNNSSIITQNEEDKKEAAAVDQQVISILTQIAKNTSPSDKVAKATKEEEGIGLGAIAAAIAIALGAVVAAIKSQIKAIKYFLDLLVPDKLSAAIAKSFASFIAGLSMQFDLIKASISEKLSSVTKIFDNVIDWVKGLFGAAKESKLGTAVQGFFTFLGKVADPFIDAGKVIIEFLSGSAGKAFDAIKNTFSTIATYLGEFGSMVGKVAVVLEKFFLPLTIIMTVWDTVKGAIEGFEKEGIIGGIKGAITGFFNSLIFGPIDMLKEATAWVAGFFGFDKVKEALQSFSFEKLFKEFIDTIFKPIDVFKDIMKKMENFFESLKAFEIPAVTYTVPKWIPIWGGKEKSFGPWQPFKDKSGSSSSSSSETPDSSSSSSSAPIASSVAPASSSTAGEVTQRSNNVTSMKEDAAAKGAGSNAVVAPSVNNNMNTTQVATLKAPVRSADPSFDRYVSSRVVF